MNTREFKHGMYWEWVVKKVAAEVEECSECPNDIVIGEEYYEDCFANKVFIGGFLLSMPNHPSQIDSSNPYIVDPWNRKSICEACWKGPRLSAIV